MPKERQNSPQEGCGEGAFWRTVLAEVRSGDLSLEERFSRLFTDSNLVTDMNRIAIVAQLVTLAAAVVISGECRGDPVASPPPVSVVVLVAGNVWDGLADAALGPMEILVRDGRIAAMGRTVERPAGCRVVDLSKHTATPGFIDCHVHVTMRANSWCPRRSPSCVLQGSSTTMRLGGGQ